jgi:hypothetical protein
MTLGESFDRIAPCPTCGEKPTAATPRIEPGRIHPCVPQATLKDSDRIAGFTLQTLRPRRNLGGVELHRGVPV